EASIPLSGTKWKGTSVGYRYKDPTASESGIKRMALRAGTSNDAAVIILGRGAQLPHVRLPVAGAMTVQLVNGSNGLCLGASYSGSRLITNDSKRLRAKAIQ